MMQAAHARRSSAVLWATATIAGTSWMRTLVFDMSSEVWGGGGGPATVAARAWVGRPDGARREQMLQRDAAEMPG